PARVGGRGMAERRLLFEGVAFTVGEFHCGPEDDRWARENVIADGPQIVFPGTPVWIEYPGKHPIVADRNQVMFYNDGQAYRRRLLADTGDHCVFVAMSPEWLRQVAAQLDPSASAREGFRFPWTNAYVDGETFLLKERIIARLVNMSPGSEAEVQRALFGMACRALAAAGRRPGPDLSSSRPATQRARVEVVEATKALLARHLDRRLAVACLAREVHLSPYQLASIFRGGTGLSIHEYHTQLRLRASLPRLRESQADLAGLAVSLGYRSHSHFTEIFRRTFGAPPSRAARLL